MEYSMEYCNGWTNGYISAWNSEHLQSRTPSTIQTDEKGLPVFVHLSLNCKTNSDNSHNCRYVNGTYSQLPIKYGLTTENPLSQFTYEAIYFKSFSSTNYN